MMMQKRKRKQGSSYFTGLPGVLNAVDHTFDSIQEMAKSLDDFLIILHKVYQKEQSLEGTPNLFGFIIRELSIRKESRLEEARITCDPGKGIAVIRVPTIEAESQEQWQKRQNEILAIYFTTLPVAQIQAKVQLFRLLSDKGRSELNQVTDQDISELCRDRSAHEHT